MDRFALVLDSSLGALKVTLGQGSTLISVVSADGENNQLEEISEVVSRLISTQGIEFGDLDYLGVVVGPGRFSSLRVGVSFIKVLAGVLSLPVVAMRTLDLLGYQVKQDFADAVVCLDARRSGVFMQRFLRDSTGYATSLEPGLLSLDLGKEYLSVLPPHTLICGSGARVHHGDLDPDSRLDLAPLGYDSIWDRSLTECSYQSFQGGMTLEAGEVDVFYLRSADTRKRYEVRDSTGAISWVGA